MLEQRPQSGKTGGDEVDGWLGRCPRHHLDAVPGDVGEDVVFEEVDESDDGADDPAAESTFSHRVG